MASQERATPRISLNKLGEYMMANSGRRRQIVRDQKRPRDFVVARYVEVRRAIVEHLIAGANNEGVIMSAIEELNGRPSSSDWQEQDRVLSIGALESYLDIDLGLDDGISFRAGEERPPRIAIGGVDVSVRPELVMTGTDSRGRDFIGAVKLHIVKGQPLDEDGGAFAATVLKLWADQSLATERQPTSRQHCIVIDIFGGDCFEAPKSHQRRMNHVEAACEEISLRWPSA